MRAVTLATYNVGGRRPAGMPHAAFDKRRAIVERLVHHHPDVIALQEVPLREAERLRYDLAAHGYRSATPQRPEGVRQMTFYAVSRFRSHLASFLRLDPLGPPERGQDRPRYLLHARLLAEDGSRVGVCNVHLMGTAYKRAAVATVARDPDLRRAFLLGDFNLTPRESLHARLRAGGWTDAAGEGLRPDPGPTIHRFGAAKDRRIDWILAPPGWRVERYHVARSPDLRLEPSDHHLVLAVAARDAPPAPLAEVSPAEAPSRWSAAGGPMG